jgi:transcriptional regulator with XRE-family HTH domain
MEHLETLGSKQTPGGKRLKLLRQYTDRSQLDVELDASLGIGYLQRVESGKVRHPERNTLERILTALDAHYTERRDILELFGYVMDSPLPTPAERKWAVNVCGDDLDSAVFPAYLLDCAHRLLSWNAFLPKVFNMRIISRQSAPVSILRLLFDPAYGLTPLITNQDVFFPAQIRALRYEMRLFQGEDWYDALIGDVLACCPLFERYWAQAADGRTDTIAARPLVPLELTLPAVGRLRFRLTSEPFAQDRRFRVIYYLAADMATMQQCIAWLPVEEK